jgi:hypothetical protein
MQGKVLVLRWGRRSRIEESLCSHRDACRSVFDQTVGPRAPPGAQQHGDLPEQMRTIEARLELSSRTLIGPSIDESLRLIQALVGLPQMYTQPNKLLR